MYSETELAKISQLPAEVQALSKEAQYESLFVNYCDASEYEDLAPGTQIKECEFYYGSDSEPAVIFADGYLSEIDDVDKISDPSTFQIFGEDHMLFIQVKGHVILNRLKNAELPKWESRKLGNELAVLQENYCV